MLEAGRPDYDNFIIRMPAAVTQTFRSVYDWQYETSGEKSCNGRNVFLQRGKVSQVKIMIDKCVGLRFVTNKSFRFATWQIDGLINSLL
jgi:hypothetical protein